MMSRFRKSQEKLKSRKSRYMDGISIKSFKLIHKLNKYYHFDLNENFKIRNPKLII